MDKIVGVRFKKTGKLYYFNYPKFDININDDVIANSDRGEELGKVVKILDKSNLNLKDKINDIIRVATKVDMDIIYQNEEKAKESMGFCKSEAKKMNLSMKILAAEYTFDRSKLIIYFSSEERIDFRELVKVLASKYKSRIELRQIGPRDEVKAYPNFGMCGKEVCCRTFLQEFDSVTIKMAKEQGLQINMSKLSGSCGKLMCCLKYEEETYKENLKLLPKVGDVVTVDGESGKVISLDILNLKVRVKFGTTKEDEKFEIYPVDMVKWDKSNIKK